MMTVAKFEITRDSVCMGDDIYAPHLANLDLEVTDNIEFMIEKILQLYKLASVVSDLSTWICEINHVDVALLKVTDTIHINKLAEVKFLSVNTVHFKYVW